MSLFYINAGEPAFSIKKTAAVDLITRPKFYSCFLDTGFRQMIDCHVCRFMVACKKNEKYCLIIHAGALEGNKK